MPDDVTMPDLTSEGVRQFIRPFLIDPQVVNIVITQTAPNTWTVEVHY